MSTWFSYESSQFTTIIECLNARLKQLIIKEIEYFRVCKSDHTVDKTGFRRFFHLRNEFLSDFED